MLLTLLDRDPAAWRTCTARKDKVNTGLPGSQGASGEVQGTNAKEPMPAPIWGMDTNAASK